MKTSTGLAVALVLPMLLAPRAGVPADGEVQHVEVTKTLDAEWASYRYAYEAAAFTGKILRKRPLVQTQMQLRPIDPATPLAGLKVRLVGAHTDMSFDVDDIGLVDLPQVKQAYDDDAVLRLNRLKGLYRFSGRYSIRQRADGAYSAADLREACEQLIGAQRDSGYRLRLWGKKCVGVKFVYPAMASGDAVEVHGTDDHVSPITTVDGKPFEDDSMGTYRIAVVRFADWPVTSRVVTRAKPLAIGTLYE